MMNQYLRDKSERMEIREAEGAAKAKIRHAELETRQHEDHLRHFQVDDCLLIRLLYLFQSF